MARKLLGGLLSGAALLLGGGSAALAADPAGTTAAPLTELAVESVPAGAVVYVDGEIAGRTPLRMKGLEPGDHRVALRKEGYLDNNRVVRLGAGATETLRVELTALTGAVAGPTPEELARQRRRERRWTSRDTAVTWGGVALLALSLSGLSDGDDGAGVPAGSLGDTGGGGSGNGGGGNGGGTNQTPEAGVLEVTPLTQVPLAAATELTFTAQGAQDPDDDPLTFSWTFDDGTSAETATATTTHTYSSAGDFVPVVEVCDDSDACDVAASASGAITVASMTGRWEGFLESEEEQEFLLDLTQTGESLGGTSSGDLAGPVSGSVFAPRDVDLTIEDPSGPVNLTGTVNGLADAVEGTATGGSRFTLFRQ